MGWSGMRDGVGWDMGWDGWDGVGGWVDNAATSKDDSSAPDLFQALKLRVHGPQ